MSRCEFVEVDESCNWPVEYRCVPWNTEGDYLETSDRLVCGDAEHLLQTVADLIGRGAASVDVSAWVGGLQGSEDRDARPVG